MDPRRVVISLLSVHFQRQTELPMQLTGPREWPEGRLARLALPAAAATGRVLEAWARSGRPRGAGR